MNGKISQTDFLWPQSFDLFKKIRLLKPVIHCITNYVTARDTANLLLAAGASPVMADHPDEAAEIASISQAEVLNLGTFRDWALSSMLKAGKTAAGLSHPIVLDPVGVGSSSLRMEAALRILEEIPCTVIRGNASEIMALAARILDNSPSLSCQEKGVDSSIMEADEEEFLRVQAGRLARAVGGLVIMTGSRDLITDGRRFLLAENGHPLMSRITGSGCMLDGILAAALAAVSARQKPSEVFVPLSSRLSALLPAAAYAVCAVGICGQQAWEKTCRSGGGTGTFYLHFMDSMSLLTDETVLRAARIKEISVNDAIGETSKPPLDLRLYAVTDRTWTDSRSLLEQLEEALKSGVTLVQLREKNLDHSSFLKEALEVKALTDRYQVPLIINDNIQIALDCNAAGVHLGQEDMDPRRARHILGPNRIIGVTAKTIAQARKAQMAGADYLGSGAVFGSKTKKEALPMPPELLKQIASSVTIPVAAIGGINKDNISRLAGTGICGAAVVSGIFAQEDISGSAGALRRAVDQIIDSQTGRIPLSGGEGGFPL